MRQNPRGGSTNLLFGKRFAKNCINMKEIGPRGGRFPSALCRIRQRIRK